MSTEDFEYIKSNYLRLCEDIESCSARVRRRVSLLPVTKSGTDEELIALCRLGISAIGENRPQELVRRGELLRSLGFDIELHEIGNLQKNKVRHIVPCVSLIHSLDSEGLAREIQKRADAEDRYIPVLVEINSAGEEGKSGVMPEQAVALAASLSAYPRLLLSGVMTMGPVVSDAEEIRPYFTLARRIYEEIGEKYGYRGEGILSMGMSDSYRIAIEEGATLVRVGSILFRK